MHRSTPRTATFGIVPFALGATTTLVGQTLTDSPLRKEQKRADKSGATGMELIESVTGYHQGDRVELHRHHGLEAADVVQGSMIRPDGKAPVLQPTGNVLLNLRDAKHGGWTVVGDTPLTIFTVHVVDEGAPLYDFR